MKIKHIIIALTAALFATACAEESIAPSYDTLVVSKNFIALEAGVESTFTLTSLEDWSIYKPLLPTHDEDGELIWDLQITPESGSAGTHTITVKTDSTLSTRQAELCIVIGDRTALDAAYKAMEDLEAEYEAALAVCLTKAETKAVDKQFSSKVKAAEAAVNAALVNSERVYVTLKQTAGKQEIKYITCEEANALADGPTVYVKGSVTKIENTLYGNWTLKDDTGDLYIYGTLDANGAEKNFESLGLAEGDEVFITGPRGSYNGKPQIVNATVLKINKAFIKLEKNSIEVAKDSGSFEIPLTLMDDAKWNVTTETEWLTVKSTHPKDGKTIVTVDYAAFEELAKPRTGTLLFTATKEVEEENEDGEKVKVTKSAELTFTVTQTGVVPTPVAIKEAVAAAKKTWVAVQGIVTAVCGDGIIITDKAGDVLLGYKAVANLGDEVVVYGERDDYNLSFQLKNTVVEVKSTGNEFAYPKEPVAVTEAFVAEFAGLTAPQLAKYVKYTGVVNEDKYNTLNVGETYKISPYTSGDFILKNAQGKKITIEGYTYGYASKYSQLNMIITKVAYAKTDAE